MNILLDIHDVLQTDLGGGTNVGGLCCLLPGVIIYAIVFIFLANGGTRR